MKSDELSESLVLQGPPEAGELSAEDLAEELQGERELAGAHAVQAIARCPVEAWEPFLVQLLPEPLRRIVVGTAAAMGCDESYVALPLLSMLAGVIGNSRSVQLEEGWDEPAVIWTAVVGESGTLKSPALEVVLRPLQRRQVEASFAHDRALEEYEIKKATYRIEYSAWRRRLRYQDRRESERKIGSKSAHWLEKLLALPDGSASVVAGLLTEPRGATGGLLSRGRPAVGGAAGSGDPRRTGEVVADAASVRHPPTLAASATTQHEITGLVINKQGHIMHELPPVLERPPVCRQYFVSDATIEELAVLLSENPRGVLLARDELAGWLTQFDSRRGRKGNNMAYWLSMFRSLPLVLRRTTGDHRKVNLPRPTVSVTGGIQPDVLKEVREQNRNGLLPRLLLAYPPVRDRPWVRKPLDPRLEGELDELIAKLDQLELDPGPAGTCVPRPLTLTPEAQQKWMRFYRAWGSNRAASTGEIAASFSKTECYGARLALVIHLVRAAMGEASPDAIDGESMHCGSNLAGWFAKEAARIYGRLEGKCHPDDRNNLVEWIRKRGGSVTVRDLNRGLREYRTQVAAEAALRALAQHGLGTIRVRKAKGVGAPRVSFQLRDDRW